MQRQDILIEADELLTKLDDPNLRIFDATIVFDDTAEDAHSVYLHGHIPGAVFFDHQLVTDQDGKYPFTIASEAQITRALSDLGISNANEVIFYTPGNISTATRAWWILRYAGHENVRVLNGGLAAWKNAGGEVEQEANTYPQASFTPAFKPGMFASKEDVQAAIEDGAVCTVFTLPEEYYPDMIVGSVRNSFFNLVVDGSYLSSDDLRDRLKSEADHDRVITYCGGGIAATANAIAHLLAGNENVAVYDGSLAEWTGEGLPTT